MDLQEFCYELEQTKKEGQLVLDPLICEGVFGRLFFAAGLITVEDCIVKQLSDHVDVYKRQVFIRESIRSIKERPCTASLKEDGSSRRFLWRKAWLWEGFTCSVPVLWKMAVSFLRTPFSI